MGILDVVEKPIIQAVFSHCFTCSKEHPASYRICKALASQGIQVLRFDFTGLGKVMVIFLLQIFQAILAI